MEAVIAPVGSKPNQVPCACGEVHLVSQNVLKRRIDCIKCGRVWAYKRHHLTPTLYQKKLIGNWSSVAERELAINQRAVVESQDIGYRTDAKKGLDEYRR